MSEKHPLHPSAFQVEGFLFGYFSRARRFWGSPTKPVRDLICKSIINPPQKRTQVRYLFCGGAPFKNMTVPMREQHRKLRSWPRQSGWLGRYFKHSSCARYLGQGRAVNVMEEFPGAVQRCRRKKQDGRHCSLLLR